MEMIFVYHTNILKIMTVWGRQRFTTVIENKPVYQQHVEQKTDIFPMSDILLCIFIIDVIRDQSKSQSSKRVFFQETLFVYENVILLKKLITLGLRGMMGTLKCDVNTTVVGRCVRWYAMVFVTREG